MQNNKATDYEKANSFPSMVRTHSDKTVSSIMSFLDKSCLAYSKGKRKIYKGKRKIYKEHDINNTQHFNFFESISGKWYRENFYSNIL